jgi:tRNA U34 5-methylaminomethyl-2-thiouridine-forming methyltransferase MnmC
MEYTIEFITTKDGTNTLFSQEYNQHYHNCNDGALHESLSKHVIPAFKHISSKKTVHILDICFGLGYNTLATLYYNKLYNLNKKIHIYSPELDHNLLKSLSSFSYPKEFQPFFDIIQKVSKEHYYEDEECIIEVYNGDARKYLKELIKRDVEIDILYQDPFSSDVNKLLWTVEYFGDIVQLLKEDAIVTTYAVATPVRLSMYQNDLLIYEIQSDTKRKSTIALRSQNDNYHFVDMELKKQRNKDAKALYDKG